MTHSSLTTSLAAAAISVLAILPATAQENIRGATTAPTTAPGYDHRDQFAHLKTIKSAGIPHPNQDKSGCRQARGACHGKAFRRQAVALGSG